MRAWPRSSLRPGTPCCATTGCSHHTQRGEARSYPRHPQRRMRTTILRCAPPLPASEPNARPPRPRGVRRGRRQVGRTLPNHATSLPYASEAATGAEPMKLRLAVGKVELTHQGISVRHLDRLVGGLLLATSPRVAWATLLRRPHGCDVLACGGCGGRLRVLNAITEPAIARKILDHLGWRAVPVRPRCATRPTTSSDGSARRAPPSRWPRAGAGVGEEDTRPRCGEGGVERAGRTAFARGQFVPCDQPLRWALSPRY